MKNKNLKFTKLRKNLSEIFNSIKDKRQTGKITHTIHDTLMSAFAMFFSRDPSLLQFQKRLKNLKDRNNLETLFNVITIPSDSQMRSIIDNIESWKLFSPFRNIYKLLQRGKILKKFEFMKNNYLFNIDGSEYFSSDKIHCPHCLFKEKKKGKIKYYHLILQGILVHPDMKQVIPFAPEQICNTDGTKKQDCEMNAFIRILKRLKKDFPRLSLTFNGDGLFSNNTVIKLIKSISGYHFIFVAKPGNHKSLFEDIKGLRDSGEIQNIEVKDYLSNGKHRIFQYSWINDIPLTGQEDSVNVNYFEFTLINEKGKKTRHNSWVTDIEITKDNIEHMVRGGRARWKIENEGFNTLKNQGYNIEHNYGHGEKNLSFNLFVLNLLAFTWHQVFELTDLKYIKLRKFYSKNLLWEYIRGAFRLVVYEDWESIVTSLLPDEVLIE